MPGTAGNFGGFYTPFYGANEAGTSYQPSSSFSTGARAGGAAGMSSAMGGALTSVAGSLISGYFSSQSEARQSAASAKMQRDNNLANAYREDKKYKAALEDRLQNEKGWDQYRPMYKGSQPLMAAPEFTDPNSVVLKDPFAKKK